MPADRTGKTPVQKTVTREGKTHQQTFWVKAGQDAPRQRPEDMPLRTHIPDKMYGQAAKKLSESRREAASVKAGTYGSTKEHHEHGARAAEAARQEHHKGMAQQAGDPNMGFHRLK